MAQTNWIGGSGTYDIAANWSNGVPVEGVDAVMNGTATAPLSVVFTGGNYTANSLTTTYTTFTIEAGDLALQYGSTLTSSGTGYGLVQTGGLIDFQNGETGNGSSSISGYYGAVEQKAGTLQIDQGGLTLDGDSSFAGTIAGIGGGTVIFSTAPGQTGVDGSGETYMIANGGKITTAEWQVVGTETAIILQENLSYAGIFDEADYTNVVFGGYTLTLSGTVNSQAWYQGPGKVLVSGTFNADSTGNGGGPTVGAGVTFELSGLVSDAGNSTIGGVGFYLGDFYLGDSNTAVATLQIDTTGILPPRRLGWVETVPLVFPLASSHFPAFLGSAERGRFFVPA